VTAEPARVISVRNPWAWRIVAGLQVVVVRPWKPSWRGVLWVHASENSDLSAPAGLWPSRSQLINSAIIGHVTLAGVEGRPGAWRWVLTNPRQLAEPVTGVHGHPGLWLMDLPPRLTADGNGPQFLPGKKGGYGWRYCTCQAGIWATVRSYAWRVRLPQIWAGFTRMKCAGTPSTHGSSPASINGARSASVSR
jgi:hypothetical protein